ncbi:MFS transporter [uncultured Corynebacterium sp.]|uniref:MFS transporter n=1 Tax=uncultured Corynebacterium sp. TaxID=159447 RepID=UPI0025F18D82|nr:MFS transporter [uncultured Corynebacterium sp.]
MHRTQLSAVLVFVAVVLSALNLRAGVSSLAPVLGQVRDAFGVSTATAGVLTSLPGLCFALMGWCAVPIARRTGLSPTIAVGTAGIIVGLALRPWVGSFAAFFLLTVLVVAGIAVQNVLLPAWIKNTSTPLSPVVAMSAYTAVLGLSGAIGPASALVSPGDWQQALFLWLWPAVLAVVVWVFVWRRLGRDLPRPATAADLHQPEPEGKLFTSPTAWFMLGFFGLQSAGAYVQMGWLPQMLIDRGVDEATASWALILLGAVNVVGGVLMPWLAARMRNLIPVPIVLSGITIGGWLGVLCAADAAPLLWAFLLGTGGMCFPLVLALLAERTRSPLMTARLSGFAQPGGYLVAGGLPLLVGVLYSHFGGWDEILWLLIGLAGLMAFFGAMSARRVFVDDEVA